MEHSQGFDYILGTKITSTNLREWKLFQTSSGHQWQESRNQTQAGKMRKKLTTWTLDNMLPKKKPKKQNNNNNNKKHQVDQ